MKRLIAIMLMLCMTLSLCACNGSNDPTEPTNVSETPTVPDQTDEVTEEPTVADGMVVYTVKVVDEGGNPVAGVIVQWCLETCFPGVTNAEGVAQYTAAEADYHVQINSMPAGYDYSTDEKEFSYETGSTELTIVLKAVA